jgi:hypothetical protein
METITFLIQGSAETPYRVVFAKEEETFTARCSCPAGLKKTYCKHRTSILAGDSNGVSPDDRYQVQTVRGWLKGSKIAEAMQQVEDADELVKTAERNLAMKKRALAAAMEGA